MEQQVAKRARPAPDTNLVEVKGAVEIHGEAVRIEGRPGVDRVTIIVGQGCEITVGSHEAIQFALLLLSVASTVYQEHLGVALRPHTPAPAGQRVM